MNNPDTILGLNPAAGTTSPIGRLEVTVPDEPLVAGQNNSISFIVRNPYPFEITVTGVLGPQTQSLTASAFKKAAMSDDGGEGNKTQSRSFLRNIGSMVASASLSFGGIRVETNNRSERVVNLVAAQGSHIKFDHQVAPYTTLNIKAHEDAHIEVGSKAIEAVDESMQTPIPPGSEQIFTISVRTTSWLLFTPRRFPVNIQLDYVANGNKRTQVIASSFSINPPLTSILIGAVIGGGLGAVARILQTPADFSVASAVQGVAAIVMSVIASITLSRKTNAQSFITVEDFFGAFAIGALIGYGGSEYFRRAIMPTSSEQTT